MNKLIALIALMLGILTVVIGGFSTHRTIDNVLHDDLKNREISCIEDNILRIKKEPQCMQYRVQIQNIEKPNCLGPRTITVTMKIMNDAREHSCRVDIDK